MTSLHDVPGSHYTYLTMAAVASGDNTAYVGGTINPLNGPAKIIAIHLIPIAAITGDNTNSNNYNVDIVASTTEIANLDLATGTDAVLGVPLAFTLSGTAAQLTVAAGGVLLVEREETGTQPVRIAGHAIRFTWKGM
jgi:hypothetical protein